MVNKATFVGLGGAIAPINPWICPWFQSTFLAVYCTILEFRVFWEINLESCSYSQRFPWLLSATLAQPFLLNDAFTYFQYLWTLPKFLFVSVASDIPLNRVAKEGHEQVSSQFTVVNWCHLNATTVIAKGWRAIALQPPGELPPQQLPPRTMASQNNCDSENCHLCSGGSSSGVWGPTE